MTTAITRGIHHLGLTVSRLEESAAFFTDLLGWKVVRRNEDYPAIYISDGNIMLTLWAVREEPAAVFNKDRHVGLHHVAFAVASEDDLDDVHRRLLRYGISLEFAPEPLGNGPARHMICYDPSGIRVELIWPGVNHA